MPVLIRLIRNTSVPTLQDFFTHRAIDLPVAVNWEAPEPEVVRSLLQAVDEMDALAVARAVNDAERVVKMADDAGQTAIYSVIQDRTRLDELRSAHDRALWLFLNSAVDFQIGRAHV